MDVIFSKMLSPSDIEFRLSVPTQSLKSFPIPEDGRSCTLMVGDRDGESWSFSLTTRRSRYPKPSISGGWLRFVRSKSLSAGDKITVLEENDEDTGEKRFKIQIEKPVRLFGQKIWQSSESEISKNLGRI